MSVELRTQGGIFASDEIATSNITGLDRLARNQRFDYGVKSLINQDIGLLLGVVRINQESAGGHHIHVVVFCTCVNINGLWVKNILVTLDVEFVRSEDFATLN